MSDHESEMFSAQTWISWLGGLAVTFASVTAFAFVTFETKTDFEKRRDEDLASRVRIEQKIDQLQQSLNQLVGGQNRR